ncbi:hypothetical protein [uncultured Mitsuokella sp.]|uniref:hypothetical protein n=1 Tax=uncultured Mitsuokella sp. TaxID=453120 RepID=UPI0026158555|nr:hypothetical protein [uncultured Mitsuokella sp.]
MLRIIFKEKAPALVKKRQLEEEYGIRLTEDETKELSKSDKAACWQPSFAAKKEQVARKFLAACPVAGLAADLDFKHFVSTLRAEHRAWGSCVSPFLREASLTALPAYG